MTRRLVVVSAGLSTPSSTRLLADRLAEAVVSASAARGSTVEAEHVELRPLAHPLADRLLTGFSSGDLAHALAKVGRADGLVVVTPVFAASYSGLFKTFMDVLDPGTLDGTPVLIAATGGTARHSMVLDHALRPLLAHLRALVVPTGVFAASEDFGSTDEGHLDKRIRRASGELAALMGAATEPAPSMREQRSLEEQFEAPTPFDELLRRASEG